MTDRLVGLLDINEELNDFLEEIEYQWKIADLSILKELKDHSWGVEVLIYDGLDDDKSNNMYATIIDLGEPYDDEDIDDLVEDHYAQFYDDENQVLLGI